MKKTPKHH